MEAAKKNSNTLTFLERLSREPAVTEFQLASMPISKLIDEIDAVDVKADAITDDEIRKERIKASVDRCREAFALLLLEIPPEEMSQMQKKSIDELLQASPAPVPAAPAPVPAPAPTLQVVPEEEAEDSMPAIPEPVKLTPPPRTPKMPPKPEAAAVETMMEIKAPPPKPAPVQVEPPLADKPELEMSVMNEKSFHEPATNPGIVRALPPVQSALAKELLEVASTLENGVGKLSEKYITRLVLQHHIMALETECQEKFENGLRRLWPQRKTVILKFLDPGTQAVSQSVQGFLKKLQTNHPEWIQPFDISIGWLNVMLRYWLSDTPVDNFRPSLSECGFILCLFGQTETESMDVTNLMGVSGLSADQIQELVSRLNRLHRFRNALFAVRESLSVQTCETMRADLAACFQLIQKLQISSGEG